MDLSLKFNLWIHFKWIYLSQVAWSVYPVLVFQVETFQWGNKESHSDHGWTGRPAQRHAGAGECPGMSRLQCEGQKEKHSDTEFKMRNNVILWDIKSQLWKNCHNCVKSTVRCNCKSQLWEINNYGKVTITRYSCICKTKLHLWAINSQLWDRKKLHLWDVKSQLDFEFGIVRHKVALVRNKVAIMRFFKLTIVRWNCN